MFEEKVPSALSNCQSGKEQMNFKLKGEVCRTTSRQICVQ